MIYKHTSQEIDAYHASPETNQSGLKYILDNGVEAYLAYREQQLILPLIPEEEKPHFIIGKGVDCILTEGEEAFTSMYHFSRLKRKPSETVMIILKMAFNKIPQDQAVVVQPQFYKNELWEACNEAEYYMNRKKEVENDTRYETLLKDMNTSAYWEELMAARGKQILSETQYNVIQAISHSFKTHEYSKELFDETLYQGTDYDIIYQMPLFWYEPVPQIADMREKCKALLDIIVVDHRVGNIFPLDIKTMGDFVTRFPYWCKKRRYDIQGSFYTRAISQCLNDISAKVGRNVSGYRIQNFSFIVESTIKCGVPLKFPMTDTLLTKGAEGDGRILGYQELLNKWAVYRANAYSVERLAREYHGVLWMDEDYNIDIHI